MAFVTLLADAAALATGLLLVARALVDAFNVVLLPRSTRQRSFFVRVFFRWSWAAWSHLAGRIRSSRRRDDVLAVYGPLSMVALFASWVVLLVVGFGLLHWVAGARLGTGPGGLLAAVLLSADMFFTLGSAAAELQGRLTHLLGVTEAGIGFGFIALTIGYLPVLYGQFSLREAYILRFQVRAAPGWSAGDVIAFYDNAAPDLIDRWLREAEFWIADLMVSHNSYPMLAFYRSQRENPSWLASIAAILDTCSVLLALDPRRRQADATYTAGVCFLVDLGASFELAATAFAVRDRAEPFAVADLARRFGAPDLDGPILAREIERRRTFFEPELCRLAAYLALPLPPLIAGPLGGPAARHPEAEAEEDADERKPRRAAE